MPTFKSRIEEYVGTTSDDTALTNWLTQGATFHVRLLTPDQLYRYASEQSVSASGFTIGDSIILEVDKSGNPSTQYPPNFKGRLTDSGSIHKATEFSPAHILRGGKLFVYPDGGTALTVDMPSVAFGDTEIDVLPPDLEGATALYAALQFLVSELSSDLANVSNTLSLGNVPTLPVAPTKSSLTSDYSDVDTRLTDDDIELSQGRLKKIETRLGEFARDIQKYSSEVQAELGKFSSDINADTTEFQVKNRSVLEKINARAILLESLTSQYQSILSPYLQR